MASITNSPGAILQAGSGNVQKALSTGTGNIRSELQKLVDSDDVKKLPAEDRQAIIDVADVLANELDRPTPDPSRLARWGKRLVELAERFGVAVAASGVSNALFG
jgi:hypothetical protein